MAEWSAKWTTSGAGSGDQVAGYTQAYYKIIYEILSACLGFEGVAPGLSIGELEGAVTGANTVQIDPGGAMVDGHIYHNSAAEDVNIPNAIGVGNTRIDRIVLRCDWSAFTVRLYRIAGTDAGTPTAPAITQTSGTTYDILLYQALVNTSGDVTLTDERVWAAPEVDDSTIEVVQTSGVLQVKDEGVTPAKILNRTRSFMVEAQRSLYTANAQVYGWVCPDDSSITYRGYFTVPEDYVSDMVLNAVWLPLTGSGNIRVVLTCRLAALGEAWNTHDYSLAEATVAVPAGDLYYRHYGAISVVAATAGEHVVCGFTRDGADALDTAGTIFLQGFLVSYTADG